MDNCKETITEKAPLENQTLIIFGSNGDLARRKLLPAVFQLYIDRLLPQSFMVIGTGSRDCSEEQYRAEVRESLILFAKSERKHQSTFVDEFLSMIHYIQLNNREEKDFGKLKTYIDRLLQESAVPKNIIYYFSIPPFLYETVAKQLVKHSLNRETDGWKRIIVEKPFGYSYETAKELDEQLHKGFKESQIYRIDHYLGKETVQNIMVTRFANGFFEPVWNRKYIDRIEITASETLGVGKRGGYYDGAGAMRDMIQNHLLQVLAVVAMEPPVVFDSDAIRNETVKVLQALRPIEADNIAEHVIRGQYIATTVNGKLESGYRQEEGVKPDSRTETFVAMKLFIDNWRWGDVPFYIRTGKHLPEQATEVVIHLKPAPHQLFKRICAPQPTNMIILRIQPDAGVAIDFGMKIPGAGYQVQNVNMAFHYSDLTDSKIPEAYERLLLDCMTGDSTLYARTDAVNASWKFVDSILKAWQSNPDIPLYFYECNTWGPTEANNLFTDRKTKWRPPFPKFKTH
ncbi:MAG: glucose-6-phosphate dehydrogenase [Prevotellaceae bacterium]|jgi:glucose-6-phosphate 1-dehydrogenase|nr:glucose-6-phosphate dehydrogenase [Prevotellaceae bacterium]